ncbi:hypothetical protein BC628DRAFT_1398366 [Trametes gibbosa]|nr:hypothetical protein BC628DRAFT_1398366 [Trametes gibbosa]
MADTTSSLEYIIAFLANSTLEKSISVGMLALMLYELCITFDREVELFWSMPFSRTTLVFLLNRYISLMKYPISMVALRVATQKSCDVVNIMGEVLESVPYVFWAMFSAMRVYALAGRSIFLGSLVFLLLCVPIGTNAYQMSVSNSEFLGDPVGCVIAIAIPTEQLYLALLLVTRACAILGDVIVIIVTWYKTYRGWRAAVSAGMKTSLSEMVIRNSSIYFLVLVTLSLVHIASTLTSVFKGSIASFEEPLSSMMISRALLNLREVDKSARDATNELGTLVFEHSEPLAVSQEGDASLVRVEHGRADVEPRPTSLPPSPPEDGFPAYPLDLEEEHDADER